KAVPPTVSPSMKLVASCSRGGCDVGFGPTTSDERPTTALPHLTPLSLRPHHGCVGLAGKCFSEFWQVRQWAVHAILSDGVRVGFDHQALLLGTDGVAAELSPGDEELLFGSEAVNVGGAGLALQRFQVCQVSDLGAAEVADTLSQHQLALVMNA